MNRLRKISRRKFVQRGGIILLIPALYAWYELTGNEIRKARPGQLRINESAIPQGFSFHEEVIIHRQGSEIRAFESKCTHLGCKINQEIDGQAVCACHGSRFDQHGHPVTGPAIKALNKLGSRYDIKSEILIIDL